MPMRVGEMMVVVRAQDFASRTLHKVSGELNAMSRQQAMAYRGADITRQKRYAQSLLAQEQAWSRGLRTIQKFNIAQEHHNRLLDQQKSARQDYRKSLSDRAKGIDLARRELSMARGQLAIADMIRADRSRIRYDPKQVSTLVERGRARVAAAEQGLVSARQAPLLTPQLASLHRLNAEVATSTKALAPLERAYDGLGNAFLRAKNHQDVLNSSLAKSRQRLSEAYAGLTKAQQAQIRYNQALEQMPVQKMHRLAQNMGNVGRTLQLFGAIGTVSFGLAANAAADFNREITLAATQTREAGASFTQTAAHADILQKAILGMMQEFPASAEEMSQAAYDIYSSMTVTFGGGQKLLREFNKVAVAGGVDLVTATNASITILETFDNKLRDTGQVTQTTHDILNRMFAIVRFGRMNFAQFNDMLNSVIPAAKQAGQSFDDISGAMAVLTRHLPSQSRAATALARMFDVFMNKDFQNGMKVAKRSITDVHGALLPLPQIIEQIAALRPGNKIGSLIQILTAVGRGQGRGREFTIQARRALQPLIQFRREYREVQRQTVADNDEFANSFEAMSQTLGVKWQVFLNQLKVLVLYVGESALPAFVQIGQTIQSWIKHWQNLSQNTRDLIVRIGVFASVATLLGGVLLAVAGTAYGLLATFKGLTRAFGGPGLFASLAGGQGAVALTRMEQLERVLGRLAAIQAIVIGVTLMRKGGNWKTMGEVLTAAGIGGILGGRRGAASAALITIGVKLQPTGNEWHSPLGAAIVGGGAALMFTGNPYVAAGAAVGAAAASSMNANRQAATQIAQARDVQGRIAKLWEDGARIAALKAKNIAIQVGKEGGAKAGLAAATAYLDAYDQANLRHQRLGGKENVDFLTRAAKSADPLYNRLKATLTSVGINLGQNVKTADKLTLSKALKGAKDLTYVMDLFNKQTAEAVDKTELLATQISRAAARGNFANAARMINNFVDQTNEKLTPGNIVQKINEALSSGGSQAAAGVLQQYAQEASQATEQFQQDMKQYQQDTVQWQKDVADRQRELQRTIADTTKSTIASLSSLYSQLQTTNETAMGELFKGPVLSGEAFDLAKEWGVTASIQDMIQDVDAQVAQFKLRRHQIDILFKRGLPKGFLDELQQMTPDEAMPILKELVSATPKETRRLVRSLNARGAQIKNATKLDFRREIDSFRTAGNSMGEAIKEGFDKAQVGPWFAAWINQKFPGVIRQAVNQAKQEWVVEHPVPVAPKAPVRPDYTVRGQNKIPTGALTKQSVQDQHNNVQSANIYVHNANLTVKAPPHKDKSYIFTPSIVVPGSRPPHSTPPPPPRALGGNVINRNTYLVGERGPEMFVPHRSGRIINNKDMQRYVLPPPNPGLQVRGNIDLIARSKLHVPNPYVGGFSSVWSMSNEENGLEVLVPQVIRKQGRWVVVQGKPAWDYYQRTRRHLGKFDNAHHADMYANRLHLQQAAESRALGGTVRRGKKYLVGERGAEIFTSGHRALRRAWKWYSDAEHRRNEYMQMEADRSLGRHRAYTMKPGIVVPGSRAPHSYTPPKTQTNTSHTDNSTHIEVNYNVHPSDVPSKTQAKHDAFMIANAISRRHRKRG